MKIGQFGESFIPIYDGVGRVMKAYADTMASRGNEVYVVCPMYDAGYRGQYPFEIVDFNSVKFSKRLFYRVGLKQFDPHFKARMKQIDLDICHAHGPVFAGNIAKSIARKRNIPLVGSFHTKFYDDILEETKSKTIAKVGAKLVADFYDQCDEVWAVSDGTGETLRDYGYKGKIIVMPNGTNRRTLNLQKLPIVRETYKIRTDVPVLLFVGQINWKKNLKYIVEASSILKHQGFMHQLVFVGGGPEFEELQNLRKEKDIEDISLQTGLIQDTEALDCIYSMSDLFVFPSVYDNAPMVLREAAAQHTAGLVVEGSCSSESITHLENGIITKNTPEDIAKGIKEFFDLPKEKREAIEEKAYETIPMPWDGKLMDTILGRYENLIDMYKVKNKR
ncbi:MAG: glycosyltransferase [Sphaerochaetaceae bacterium]|nr:glycosyltransferase [Sphaerochaetaceae bacterium]